MELLLFVLVVFSQPLLANSSASHPRLNNATDQHALLQFKANMYDPFNSLHDWTPNISFCYWTGVSCSPRRQRVIALDLAGMDLQGSITPFVGNLSFLRSIDLSNSTLYGIIPPQLGRLYRLRELYLNTNNLQGHIPRAISNCPSLKVLHLGANNLSGNVPSSLGNVSSLTDLYLSRNGLQGFIPEELGMIQGLRFLDLSENQFTGQIPTSLSNSASLIALNLSENLLSGHIPEGFGSNLSQLRYLYLRFNQLSGSIPTSLADCSNLRILFLDNNRLSGLVPVELGKLPLLDHLGLHSNRLESSSTLPFLTALTNCSLLQYINLANNKLFGMLPFSIGLLSPKLYFLSLSNNSIEGYIPQQIGNLTNLAILALDSNCFRGNIPGEFVRIRKMEQLYLGVNFLEGNIPQEICMMENLGLLSLSHNMLSEEIPNSFGQLQQLRRLFLDHNQLSGKIPQSLGKCQILELLDLSHNKLSGSIPPEVAGLPNLQFYMNLSWNFLQGSLPQEIGTIGMVQAIDISINRLTGIIPEAVGSCRELVYLNVSHNAFQGPIPVTLMNLKNLEEMDLSYNFLSGTVSNFSRPLNMLRYVDFSFNNLTGEIPEEGLSGDGTIIAVFKGNPGLCGPRVFSLHACPRLRPFLRHKNCLPCKIVLIVCVSGFIVCGLFCIFVWRSSVHKRSYLLHLFCISISRFNLCRQSIQSNFPAYIYPRVSYEDLVTATNAFNEAYLLGVGSFGSVYRGVLTDGREVAIKVFNKENEEAYKSFSTECEVLRRIRHKNVVRIISTCSNHHFRSLVLPFMSNGNLGKHLYRDGDGEARNDCGVCQLSFRKRVDIALDIAHGLAYLHHDCFVQVVHCDLKPSNILLDRDMRALVADFSIAHLMDEETIGSSIPPIRGSIGYIAPEYGWGGRPSTRGDVYSFGIVLLEILTRRRPTDDMFMDELTLQNWVRTAFPDRLMDVVDFSLLNYPTNYGMDRDQLSIHCVDLVRVALLCTQTIPEERPNMKEVVRALQIIRDNAFGQVPTLESLLVPPEVSTEWRSKGLSGDLTSR